MTNRNEQKYAGLVIRSHCVRDAASKEQAAKTFSGWEYVSLTVPEWMGELEEGHTIQPSAFEPIDDGTFTHALEHWHGTHFVCCDADNLKGVEFTADGIDKNSEGIEPWADEKGLSALYPCLKKEVFAVGQSVSSMTEVKRFAKVHRRYRLIFLFDEQIITAEHYHVVLLALSAVYPIIPPVTRAPSQPVFGNAREGYNKFSICGNVLRLSDYPMPQEKPKAIAPSKRDAGANDKTLDVFLTEHNIAYEPCAKQSAKYFVQCPFSEYHTDGICKPKDAYVFVNAEGAFAFHCSHTSCKSVGRSTWQAFKDGYNIRNVTPQQLSRPCSDPIPVPVELAEKKQIAFPMEAFDGYFYDYLMAYQGSNEVCPAYHFAGLLSVVGATLGRAVFLEGVHPIYPIFYQTLIGKTTIARKSTALNLATRLLTRVDNGVVMIDNISSSEGLVDIFGTDGDDPIDTSDFEGLRGLIYYDELKNLFIKGKQKVTESITTKLTQLYNGEDQLSNNTRQNRTVAKYPTAGLLGCSTYAWLESGISIDDIVGGFANRFVFYLHEQQELIPNVQPANQKKLESVQERIIATRKQWKGKHQKFVFDDAAQKAHDQVYFETNDRLINEQNDLVAAASQRTLDYAKKLALVFAVLDAQNTETKIRLDHWERAVLVKEYWEAVATDLFSRLAVSEEAQKERLFLEKLAELGNNTTTRELQRKISGQMSGADFRRTLETHLANGVVEIHQPEGERKRYVCRVEN